MTELTVKQMKEICGGKDLACELWWLEWAAVAGVSLIGGGPIGLFGVGLALAGALSDESPCK
jgi:hypothetical protein